MPLWASLLQIAWDRFGGAQGWLVVLVLGLGGCGGEEGEGEDWYG